MVTAASIKEKATAKPENPLDALMTPAQIARRRFKAGLPRKLQNRRLSALEVLGETATLFDRFRALLIEENQDPDKTLHAALVYCLPESDPATLAASIILPAPSQIGRFCDDVMKLGRPLFLGLVFVQVDLDTDNPAYRTISFCAQFMGGPEAEARLRFGQQTFLIGIQNTTKSIKRRRG